MISWQSYDDWSLLFSGKAPVDLFQVFLRLLHRIKDKGLVVLSGCAHTGIINSIAHICKVSGIGKVHAVLGGFHLSSAGGAVNGETVQAMKKINPKRVVPTYWTGWAAINAFAAAMPDSFVLTSVGTTFLFG